MIAARLMAVATLFPAVAYGLGHLALARVTWLDRAERFAACWGVGFALIAVSQFLAFVSGLPCGPFNAAFLGILAVGMLALNGSGFDRAETKPNELTDLPLVPFLLALGLLASVQLLLPTYIGGAWAFDWWMHHGESRVFLRELPVDTVWVGHYTVASRTPMYNLTLAAVMSLAGSDFWVFQWASTLTNTAYIAALVLVLRDLFSARVARDALPLAALNVWVLHEGWFTWSKQLTCLYLLLGLHFYLRWLREGSARAVWACGLSFLLGFATHQVAAVYAAALVFHAGILMIRDPGRRPPIRDLAGLAAVALAFAAPWYLWLALTFGSGQLVASTPTSTMLNDSTPGQSTGVTSAYLQNAFVTFVPDRLIRSVAFDRFNIGAVVIHIYALYFCQVPGALTLSMSAYLVLAAITRVRKSNLARTRPSSALPACLTFILLGGLLASLLVPSATLYGLAHNALVPSMLVTLVLAWGTVAGDGSRLAHLAIIGAVIEFLAVFWSHVAWVVYYVRTGRVATDLNWRVQKEDGLVFLHDLAPRAMAIAAALVLAFQVALIYQLSLSLRQPKPVSDPMANGTIP